MGGSRRSTCRVPQGRLELPFAVVSSAIINLTAAGEQLYVPPDGRGTIPGTSGSSSRRPGSWRRRPPGAITATPAFWNSATQSALRCGFFPSWKRSLCKLGRLGRQPASMWVWRRLTTRSAFRPIAAFSRCHGKRATYSFSSATLAPEGDAGRLVRGCRPTWLGTSIYGLQSHASSGSTEVQIWSEPSYLPDQRDVAFRLPRSGSGASPEASSSRSPPQGVGPQFTVPCGTNLGTLSRRMQTWASRRFLRY